MFWLPESKIIIFDQCHSKYACNICGKTNHHTLLHHDTLELSKMYPSTLQVSHPPVKNHMKHSGVLNSDFPSKNEIFV